jgi:hypothetical protein
MEAFLARLPPCPDHLAGTGVVVAAGGVGYLVNAWVAVTMLRHHGCRLPVEVWHLGPAEMPPLFPPLFDRLGARCIDAHEQTAPFPVGPLRGWAIKPYAVLASRFRQVLLLDADNVPAADPTFLFDTAQFLETGAIFWPDRSHFALVSGARLTPDHPVWAVTGLEPRGDPAFESGQLCVDKVRCWRALGLTVWMNEQHEFWYRLLYGDKDTFHIAWRKTDTGWAMPARPPAVLGGCVLSHHDFDDRVIFQHRYADKWRLDGGNLAVPGFRNEDLCRAAIAGLRAHVLSELAPGPRGSDEVSGRWSWSRVGHPTRSIELRPDGLIGAGARRDARLWRGEPGAITLLGDDLAAQRFTLVSSGGRRVGLAADASTLRPAGAAAC